jgi:hypothetical protein
VAVLGMSVKAAEARALRSRAELRYRLRRVRYRMSQPPIPLAAAGLAAVVGFSLGRSARVGAMAWALAGALLRQAVRSAATASTPKAAPTTPAA